MLTDLNLAVQRNAGGIYITDDVLPNPWDRLPNYWTSLVQAVAMINADFNGDGVVDAADYVAWRKADGTQSGYDTWRANFGATIGSGAQASRVAVVAEPTSMLMVLVVTLAMLYNYHGSSHKLNRQ